MKHPTSLSRRELLKFGSIGVGGGILGLSVSSKVLAACLKTPVQTKGPFYPLDLNIESDGDLTKLKDSTKEALGQMIYVRGKVTDDRCNPVEGVLVEIWQACASGRYNHRSDPNPATLDRNFQYYGKATTDSDGRYLFKTIIPGAYPADTDWIRPPHIHYKVSKRGYAELITQMYFAGDPLNKKDLILQQLSPADQEAVIVKLNEPEDDMDPRAKVGEFNISIGRRLNGG